MVRDAAGNSRHSSAQTSHAYSTTVNSVGQSSTQEQDANSTSPWSKRARIDQGLYHSDGKSIPRQGKYQRPGGNLSD